MGVIKHKRPFTYSVVFRVLASLLVMVLLIIAASVVSIRSFDALRDSLNTFSNTDLPVIIDGSNVNQLSANLASFAPALIAADSPGTRQSVLLRIQDQVSWLDEILQNLQASDVPIENLALFETLKTNLVSNLYNIADLVKQRNVIQQQLQGLFQELPKLTRDTFAVSSVYSENPLHSDYIRVIQHWQRQHAEALLLLSVTATIDYPNDLSVVQAQFAALFDKIQRIHRLLPADIAPEFQRLDRVLASLGQGSNGIIPLRQLTLSLSGQVQGTLSQNKVISDQFVASSSSLTRHIRQDIARKSDQLDQLTQERLTYFLIIAFLCVAGAVLVFVYINKSVIRRLSALQKNMLRHAEGHRDAIVFNGNDEITDMARAFKYFVRNIREREKAVLDAKDLAERADQAKSRFIAAASHDLRQPLHAVGLFAADMKDRSQDPALQDTAKNIERSIQHMNDLFESILDFSQLEIGDLHADITAMPLSPVLSELSRDFQAQAIEKSLQLVIEQTDAWVMGDPLILDRILVNLLSNALRYTAKGYVNVSVSEEGGAVRIAVKDSGCGISIEQQERIFADFYRGGDVHPKDRGLGLGLSIASQMARLLGTEIDLQSQVDQGACFSLSLPASKALPVSNKTASDIISPVVPAQNSLSGERVLLVDDDPHIILAAEKLLKRWGCDVLTATTIDSADDQLRAQGDQLLAILVDYQLTHEETGLAFLQRFPQYQAKGVLISGNTDPAVSSEVKQAGYRFFSKPLRPAKLAAQLRHMKRSQTVDTDDTN